MYRRHPVRTAPTFQSKPSAHNESEKAFPSRLPRQEPSFVQPLRLHRCRLRVLCFVLDVVPMGQVVNRETAIEAAPMPIRPWVDTIHDRNPTIELSFPFDFCGKNRPIPAVLHHGRTMHRRPFSGCGSAVTRASSQNKSAPYCDRISAISTMKSLQSGTSSSIFSHHLYGLACPTERIIKDDDRLVHFAGNVL